MILGKLLCLFMLYLCVNTTNGGLWEEVKSWLLSIPKNLPAPEKLSTPEKGSLPCSKFERSSVSAIQKGLRHHLHGQHLAETLVMRALRYHLIQPSPWKALTLSFHGGVGTGKTFAAGIISKTLSREGSQDKNIHFFASTLLFPHPDKVDKYKENIFSWIHGNVSKCPFSVFIFDEIDKTPPGFLDILKPFIDSHERIAGVDFRNCIFIFLSNTGSEEIKSTLEKLLMKGRTRESITLKEMNGLVQSGIYSLEGGLHKSDIIKHNLVDFHVPFFPLEISHTRLCVKDAFERKEELHDEDAIEEVLDLIPFYKSGNRLYSNYGCRPVYSNVGFVSVGHEEL